jgi:hypothetical protein
MVYRRQRINNRRMMQCTQIWRIVLIFLTICGRFKRVHDGPCRKKGAGLRPDPRDESFAYWTRTDDERSCVRLRLQIESLLVVSITFLCSFFHASLQSNHFIYFFVWNLLQGIRQAGLPVSEWVTFLSVLYYIGSAFSSFCLSQLSHYFVTCIPKT